MAVRISYHPAKRDWTLKERQLDFEDANDVFNGVTVDIPDLREPYGEERFITFGFLRGRMVVVGWTPRNGCRHVFTMRKANEREQKRFGPRLADD
jgi:uncharacterized DUF497 family protein